MPRSDQEANDVFLRGANLPKDFITANAWAIRQVFPQQNYKEALGLPRYVFEGKPFAATRMSHIYYGFDFKINRQVVAKRVVAPQQFKGFFDRALIVEAQTMAALNHEGIPKYLDLVYHRDNQDVYPIFIMKYFAGGTLKDWKDMLGSQGVSGIELMRIVSQAAEVIDYLAAHRIVHKDIKPGNIFDVKPHIQVIDFMSSSVQDESQYFTASPGFSAPEVLRRERADVRADIFSLGATVYNLITNRHPYGEGSDKQRILNTLKGPYLSISQQEAAYLGLNTNETSWLNYYLQWSLAQNRDQRPSSAKQWSELLVQVINKY